MKKSAKKKAAKKNAKKAPAKKTAKKALKARTIPTRAKGAGQKKTAKKAAGGGAHGSAPRKAATKDATAKKTDRKERIAKSPSPKSPPRKSPVKKIAATQSRRPKSFAPRDVARPFGFPAGVPELPELYGEDRLVLMTKDPEYLFAYWEITPEKMAEGEGAKRRDEQYREALRLNWAARDLFERNFALLPVSLGARKWYLRVPFSGLSYQIELGWLSENGHFVPLLASNPSDAPESWAATRRRLKGSAAAGSLLAHALQHGRPQGSSENMAVREGKVPAPAPVDWNFDGPGSNGSSSGKPRS